MDFIKQKKVNTFFASAIRKGDYGTNWQDKIVATLSDEVYISFDVDFLDPSVVSATGTPEPNGFFYYETIEIFRKIKQSGRKIIGLDVTELAPIEDAHHCDLTIARLIYKILNIEICG
jgi:agmatinase